MGAIKNYQSTTTTALEEKKEPEDPTSKNEEQVKKQSFFSEIASKCEKCKGVYGIVLAAVAGFFVTMRSVSVNFVVEIHEVEVFLIRSIIQFAFLIPILMIRKEDPRGPKGSRLILFLQGITGSVSALLQFIAFSRLPVGEAATIFFSSPIIVMIISHCYLKESCTVYQIILVFFFLIGVLLIALPDSIYIFLLQFGIGSEENITVSKPPDVIGLVAAIFGTVFNAFNVMWMRKLQDVSSIVILFAYTVTGLFASSIPMMTVIPLRAPNKSDFIFTLLVTVYGVFSRLLLTFALKLETAGLVAMVYSLAYEILSYFLQIVWFHQVPEAIRIAGASLVVISVVAMAVENYVIKVFNCFRGKPEDDNEALLSK